MYKSLLSHIPQLTVLSNLDFSSLWARPFSLKEGLQAKKSHLPSKNLETFLGTPMDLLPQESIQANTKVRSPKEKKPNCKARNQDNQLLHTKSNQLATFLGTPMDLHHQERTLASTLSKNLETFLGTPMDLLPQELIQRSLV